MNKIVYKENSEKNINKMANNKKVISMPISVILIPLIILLFIFIFNISSKGTDYIVMANSNNIEDTQNLITVGIDEEQKNDYLNTDNVIEEKNQSEQTVEREDKNSITYTSSNGEQYSIIGTLNIPSLNIKYPILSSTSTALLKISLNKYWGANPNEVGNMVVVGHNYENSKFFSKLPNIKIGEIVKITDVNGNTLNYTVYDTDIIDPYDNSCTSQLTNGHTEITLITCYNKGKQRFIAKARAN